MSGQTMHTIPGSSQFPTTRWTLVVAAGDPHRKEARSALVSLSENYWYPLYAYLRRCGYPGYRYRYPLRRLQESDEVVHF